MNALLYALANLARLRWLGAAFCALAIVCTTAKANAIAPGTEHEQTKTRVGGFEQNSSLNVCANTLASAETHRGISSAQCETASAFSHAAVKSVYDIGSKVPIEVEGRTRIPDGLTAETLSEVKNVAYQSYTLQLRDFANYAQQQSPPLQFNLYLRPDTIMSQPLQDAYRNGTFNILTIPLGK